MLPPYEKASLDFIEGARTVLDDIMMYLPDPVLTGILSWIDALEGSLGSGSESAE
jgi:hypothetical protein